ncbi:MAG: glutathione S-transferase N-terminal domain-containing protein [Candidatus Devosia symbiotica]|nr:glutathione S-transferase N-terminal domain-containing protein [Candidatus Devosia symbiotica]
MLKILGWVTSINVRKMLWALDELGIAYEREDWSMPLHDPKVPAFLALNSNGQVPCLSMMTSCSRRALLSRAISTRPTTRER